MQASVDPVFVVLADVVYANILSQANDYPKFIDWSDIFADDPDLRWFDGVHVFPDTNAILAQAILQMMEANKQQAP